MTSLVPHLPRLCRWRTQGGPILAGLTILLFSSPVPVATAAQDPNHHLRDSVESGNTAAVRALLEESGQVDLDFRHEGGWTALMYAARSGHDAIVELLLEAGANVHLENDAMETALHLAAKHGRTEAARLLLEAGAELRARDGEGRTPLYRAIERKHADVIELLQAAAQAAADRYRWMAENAPKQETEPPKIIASAPAPYPEITLSQGIEGTVVLMVLVRRDGSIGGVSVSQGLEDSLDRSAVQAVRKWEFEPATRAGKPVDAILEVRIDFKPPEKP